MRRTLWYVYLALLGLAVVFIDARTWQSASKHPDQVAEVAFLVGAIAVLSLGEVRLDQGRLNLSGVVVGATAILLNPLNATIVGLAIAVPRPSRGVWRIIGNAVITAAIACLGCFVASQVRGSAALSLGARVLCPVIVSAAGLMLVALGLSIRPGEPMSRILRHTFSHSLYLAYAYFALASLLISYVVDGSLRGYVLATIVCLLSLALTDTIAGRRVRRVLESELSDADRHLFHSRAVEGVVHNLRNHIATAAGYLKEIDSRRLDPVDRESLETAAAATNDAVTVLRSLSQGATPRISYPADPVDLNELVARAVGMARPRARVKEVQVAGRESAEDVKVRADPLLMREVITNLMNNAIDAAPSGGHVTATTGSRGAQRYVSISDDGPGISDEHRHRLFEPHFTTKEDGTGLGLFMSYGIVREHQGQLSYEGNRRGAVFTVILPPFGG